MRSTLTRAAGFLSAFLLASAVQAADARPAAAPAEPDVLKMVILNGPTYTAHYFSVGLSASDQASLRDLERAENDAAYADDLQTLRRRYVADELALEPIRRAVQSGLYGTSISRSSTNYLADTAYWPGAYGTYGAYGYPMNYPGYFNGYPGAVASQFAGSSSTINQSLAYGVGDEGALKTTLAPVIAAQANADYALSSARAYTAALNRVGESDAMRTALNLNPRGVVAAANESARRVTLTLKAGDKVEGVVSDEDNDWITVDTATDQVSVRKADVSRIERHKK